jgi:biofilm PGA synthesis N-glycosyltransferase PgaC
VRDTLDIRGSGRGKTEHQLEENRERADPDAMALKYAVVTPVRDEAASITSLARCLEAQSPRPLAWQVVDTGSTDGTLELAESLARERSWMHVRSLSGFSRRARGGPVASAVEAGIAVLATPVDVVVKVDADVTVGPGYFAALLAAFDFDPLLGIASGTRYEFARGRWRKRYVTGLTVEAQCRAYRSACLADVLPFEKHKGWDGIDVVRATLRGWRTAVLDDLKFKHHRPVGAAERLRLAAWWEDGRAAHYMGYRLSYLLLRSAYKSLHEPSAAGLAAGFLWAALTRQPRCPEERVREYLRGEQALRKLPIRAREALGHVTNVSPPIGR